ncbi:MAG: hypothetical protein IJV62_00640 [Eggerthellaceae bacterium]|nr:hypothetical protein [Eggerthellaceae bacterium]
MLGAFDDLRNFWGEDYFQGKRTYDEWFEWAHTDGSRVIHPKDLEVFEKEGIEFDKLLKFANGQVYKGGETGELFPQIPHAFFGNIENLDDIKVVILGINPGYNDEEPDRKNFYDKSVKPLDEVLFDSRRLQKSFYPWDKVWSNNNHIKWHKTYLPENFKEHWHIKLNRKNLFQIEFFPYPSLGAEKSLDKSVKKYLKEDIESNNLLPSQQKMFDVVKELLSREKPPIFISTVRTYKFIKNQIKTLSISDSEKKRLSDSFAQNTLLPQQRGLVNTLKLTSYQTADDYDRLLLFQNCRNLVKNYFN